MPIGLEWHMAGRNAQMDEYFHARMHAIKEVLELARVRLADRGETKLAYEIGLELEQMRKDRWVR